MQMDLLFTVDFPQNYVEVIFIVSCFFDSFKKKCQ